jgi:hypothetical protein
VKGTWWGGERLFEFVRGGRDGQLPYSAAGPLNRGLGLEVLHGRIMYPAVLKHTTKYSIPACELNLISNIARKQRCCSSITNTLPSDTKHLQQPSNDSTET